MWVRRAREEHYELREIAITTPPSATLWSLALPVQLLPVSLPTPAPCACSIPGCRDLNRTICNTGVISCLLCLQHLFVLLSRLQGLEPDTICYNTMISCMERCNQPDRALAVFEHMMVRLHAAGV